MQKIKTREPPAARKFIAKTIAHKKIPKEALRPKENFPKCFSVLCANKKFQILAPAHSTISRKNFSTVPRGNLDR